MASVPWSHPRLLHHARRQPRSLADAIHDLLAAPVRAIRVRPRIRPHDREPCATKNQYRRRSCSSEPRRRTLDVGGAEGQCAGRVLEEDDARGTDLAYELVVVSLHAAHAPPSAIVSPLPTLATKPKPKPRPNSARDHSLDVLVDHLAVEVHVLGVVVRISGAGHRRC